MNVQESEEYESFVINSSIGKYNYLPNTSHQFYPNMRYASKEISYQIEENCSEKKIKDIEKAFEILSEKTILNFYRVDKNGSIIALCSEIPKEKEAEEKGYFIAGEGGATRVINATNFAIIEEGKISVFKNEMCDVPNVAIHEILHALGFDHNNNPSSIIYPISNCKQEIDDYLIEEINALYSIEEIPDIVIEKINATKTWIYLNYVIVIGNHGLKDSVNSTLRVYSADKEIGTYKLGVIEPGMKKILTAQNIRLKGDYQKLAFIIEPGNNGKDLNFENNYAEIFIEKKE